MPVYTYLQFTVDSEDMNVPGSSDVTKPSEGWKGRDANDALRATNSALRNLGDRAAKLPLDENGNPVNVNLGQIGTAAFQNITSFDMQGGVLGPNVRGSVGFGALLSVLCGPAQLDQVYAEMRQRGFDLCDGRRTRDPFPPRTREIDMPNLSGLVLRMSNPAEFNDAVPPVQDNINHARASQGDRLNANRTVSVGPHTHGNTGGFALGGGEIPPVASGGVNILGSGAFEAGNNRGFSLQLVGSQLPHAHTTGGALAFDPFTFNVFPPSVLVFHFLRVW